MIIKTRRMQKSCIWACECKKAYEIDKYLNNFTFIYCRYFCNNMWRWYIHFFIALVTNHHCLSELFYDQINVLEWKVMKLWIKLMIQVNLSFQLNVKVINYLFSYRPNNYFLLFAKNHKFSLNNSCCYNFLLCKTSV